jgi:pimeloyl-ACP methyl ester carboxylesterase
MAATVVLVHGAWHGAWCWDRVVEGLAERGVDAVAIDLPGHGASRQPLGDLHGDAAAVSHALDALDGADAIVCGHSYGGAVISEGKGRAIRRRHLVYLAAMMLDVGESCSQSIPDPPDGASASGSGRGCASATTARASASTVIGARPFYADCPTPTPTGAIAPARPHPRSRSGSEFRCCVARGAVDLSGVFRRLRCHRGCNGSSPSANNTVVWPTSHSPFLWPSVVDLLADSRLRDQLRTS